MAPAVKIIHCGGDSIGSDADDSGVVLVVVAVVDCGGSWRMVPAVDVAVLVVALLLLLLLLFVQRRGGASEDDGCLLLWACCCCCCCCC